MTTKELGHEDREGEPFRPAGLRDGILGFVFGAVIGAAAGLIGVGGGEFRIPVLLHVLRLPVKIAAGVNMLIGLFVVMLGVVRRWGQQEWSRDDLILGAVMMVASLLGAAIGARQAHRFSSPFLKIVVCIYLLVVGAWMVIEAVAHAENVLLEPSGLARWVLAAVIGFVIAALSGVLGVAGGEMRIPALIYLFALPIKEAGTISLLVSVPTVAAGAFTYRRLGHVPNRVLVVALLMGLGSILGVLIGAALLPLVDKHGQSLAGRDPPAGDSLPELARLLQRKENQLASRRPASPTLATTLRSRRRPRLTNAR
jgi:uncharacterized membrane protein YfcA